MSNNVSMMRAAWFNSIKILCLIAFSWATASWAFTLGGPQVQSLAGEPLRVEIPIRVDAADQSLLSSLTVDMPNRAAYERLGISQRIIDLNPQAMIYRNRQEELMVLIETVNPVPVVEEPFINVLLNLTWSNGSLVKVFTFLLADPQKLLVKSGQTLSEIALNILPQLEGATLDQAMIALFKANPDAFASGNINLLSAGAELSKPSQAMLRSISPADASQLVFEANQQWLSEHGSSTKTESKSGQDAAKTEGEAPKDTLKIDASVEVKDLGKQYTEQLVAEEKELEQTRSRIATLEKNIAELQRLIDQSNGNEKTEQPKKFNFPERAIVISLAIIFAGLLLWGLVRYARKPGLSEFLAPHQPIANVTDSPKAQPSSDYDMPERAKALFSGLNLDLSPAPKKDEGDSPASAIDSGPLSDTLRVKLNLARAYITIEDFSAAKKSIEEVLVLSNKVDPAITIEAQGLLAELSNRSS